MKYDVIVIGGGLAGYTSAIRCLEKGLKTALVNNGRSALHFSSGSIDLLSTTPLGTPVRFPFDGIRQIASSFPEHPYAKLGAGAVSNAIDWYTEIMSHAGVILSQQENNENHQRITTIGAVKSTFLSQQSVYPIGFNKTQCSFDKVYVVDLEGCRDFQSSMIVDNLKSSPMFAETVISSLPISLNVNSKQSTSGYNTRSTDYISALSDEEQLNHLASQIVDIACTNDLIVMPAIFGTRTGPERVQRLKAITGLNFTEVPTMPPSLMGIRLEETLESEFIQRGGVQLKGDKVLMAKSIVSDKGLTIKQIRTKNLRDYALVADAFVLATGSFFSNGLVAERSAVFEPLFGLDTNETGARSEWHSDAFLSPHSHAFLSFGVETNGCFQPSIEGRTVENVYCCGSVLAHYNPILEGSGGGVAISTAYHVANEIVRRFAHHEKAEEMVC
jgi:glycerol-3-phosphate dehydrogenase subunit B